MYTEQSCASHARTYIRIRRPHHYKVRDLTLLCRRLDFTYSIVCNKCNRRDSWGFVCLRSVTQRLHLAGWVYPWEGLCVILAAVNGLKLPPSGQTADTEGECKWILLELKQRPRVGEGARSLMASYLQSCLRVGLPPLVATPVHTAQSLTVHIPYAIECLCPSVFPSVLTMYFVTPPGVGLSPCTLQPGIYISTQGLPWDASATAGVAMGLLERSAEASGGVVVAVIRVSVAAPEFCFSFAS